MAKRTNKNNDANDLFFSFLEDFARNYAGLPLQDDAATGIKEELRKALAVFGQGYLNDLRSKLDDIGVSDKVTLVIRDICKNNRFQELRPIVERLTDNIEMTEGDESLEVSAENIGILGKKLWPVVLNILNILNLFIDDPQLQHYIPIENDKTLEATERCKAILEECPEVIGKIDLKGIVKRNSTIIPPGMFRYISRLAWIPMGGLENRALSFAVRKLGVDPMIENLKKRIYNYKRDRIPTLEKLQQDKEKLEGYLKAVNDKEKYDKEFCKEFLPALKEKLKWDEEAYNAWREKAGLISIKEGGLLTGLDSWSPFSYTIEEKDKEKLIRGLQGKIDNLGDQISDESYAQGEFLALVSGAETEGREIFSRLLIDSKENIIKQLVEREKIKRERERAEKKAESLNESLEFLDAVEQYTVEVRKKILGEDNQGQPPSLAHDLGWNQEKIDEWRGKVGLTGVWAYGPTDYYIKQEDLHQLKEGINQELKNISSFIEIKNHEEMQKYVVYLLGQFKLRAQSEGREKLVQILNDEKIFLSSFKKLYLKSLDKDGNFIDNPEKSIVAAVEDFSKACVSQDRDKIKGLFNGQGLMDSLINELHEENNKPNQMYKEALGAGAKIGAGIGVTVGAGLGLGLGIGLGLVVLAGPIGLAVGLGVALIGTAIGWFVGKKKREAINAERFENVVFQEEVLHSQSTEKIASALGLGTSAHHSVFPEGEIPVQSSAAQEEDRTPQASQTFIIPEKEARDQHKPTVSCGGRGRG